MHKSYINRHLAILLNKRKKIEARYKKKKVPMEKKNNKEPNY